MALKTFGLRIRLATGLALAACAVQAVAEDTAPAVSGATGRAPVESSVQTRHIIQLEGGALEYTATAGTLRVQLDDADTEAEVFFVSYRKHGEEAAVRPITFVFNGGPGSAAAWLHLCGLGPRRIALDAHGSPPEPPIRLVDNAQTWLHFTDLVFVDPVGTGFSRALPNRERSAREVGRRFWGVKGDLRSLGEFMRLFLTTHQRWASPKYLAGESYGGFRAAALAELLPDREGIELNGAILISPVIEYTLNLGSDYLNVMPWVTFVPSFAATALHHGRYRGAGGQSLQQVTEEAEAFSRGDLLVALASDPTRKSAEVSRAYAHLAAITGLDLDAIQRHRGRVTAEYFATRLLQNSGRVLGIYDGAVSSPDPDPFSLDYPALDPSGDPLIAPVTSGLNAYVRGELGYKTDAPYELFNREVLRAWNWAEAGLGDLPGVGRRLRSALSLNPKLKVLVAHGYFDLATPYFASKYVIERLELDDTVAPNLRLSVYPGGHMFYINATTRERFYADVRALFGASAKTRSD